MFDLQNSHIAFDFVHYGKVLNPRKNTLVLDVGMKAVPGVIDHHHPQAEIECTASLIAKYPHLVLNHVNKRTLRKDTEEPQNLKFITHRLPDFDAVASIFLSLKLIEIEKIDSSMDKIARYTKMVDSARLPKDIDLTTTPYSILRALFKSIRKEEAVANIQRIDEGLRFMQFLYTKSEEGYELLENRTLFSGIDRYQNARSEAEKDHLNYISDINKAEKTILFLPRENGKERKEVDTLFVKNPKSFLLKEWARQDRDNTKNKEGFGFLMTNFGNKKYILGVDPERGIYLKGLGDLLNQKEEERRTAEDRTMDFRWYDGNCPFFNYRIVDSPQDGTSLTYDEIIETILFFGQE
ncbi:hypothetical protein ACFLT2_02405 [Acidobacteriota bacterium]